MATYEAEVFFELNKPTRNRRVYTEENFQDTPESLPIAKELPPSGSSLERMLKLDWKDQVGDLTNIKIENDKITGIIKSNDDAFFDQFQTPIKLTTFGVGNGIQNGDGTTSLKNFRLFYFALDPITNSFKE